MVDPIRGQIIVILRKVEMSELLEKEVEIKLSFNAEEEEKEEVMENKI